MSSQQHLEACNRALPRSGVGVEGAGWTPRPCAVNTILLQRVLAEPEWAARLTDHDRRALTPLFWSNCNPVGKFTLDMDTHLDLGVSA